MTFVDAKLSHLILPLTRLWLQATQFEFKNANHDGFYSITFDSIVGATGIEFEWINEGPYKHWTVREIEAYEQFGSRIDVISGKVSPGSERVSDNPFINAFDGNIDTFTFSTSSGTTAFLKEHS